MRLLVVDDDVKMAFLLERRFEREKVDRPIGRDAMETVRGAGCRLRADGG